MKLCDVLNRIFITRKCLICGEVISYDKDLPFCDDCEGEWEKFLEIKCPKCGLSADICSCLPPNIRKISNHGASFCVFYDGTGTNSVNNLVFKLKREYRSDLVDFLSSLMSKNVKALASRHGINLSEYVVTYAPRRVKAKRKEGTDHAKRLAISLAKKLGVECEKTLVNTGALAQKLLTKKERVENAKKSYALYEGAKVSGKKYILVDDIITTGATMLATGEQLLNAGAVDIIPVSYAKNIK